MNLFFIFINIYLFASVLLTAFCAMFSFVKRRSMIHIMFACLCLCIMVYSFGYLMEINVPTIEQMLFWNQIQYFGIPFFPSTWILFVFHYTGSRLKDSNWVKAGVFIIPVATLVLRLTNRYHYFFYEKIDKASFYGFTVLALEKGPWYFVQAAFVTVCFVFAGIILLRYSMKLPPIRRISYDVVVVITFLPYLGVIANLFNLGNTYMDHTALSVPVIALILFSITFNNKILKLKSFARDKIFETSKDGIILLNAKYDIVDYNAAAKKIFPDLQTESLEKPLSILLNNNIHLLRAIRDKIKCQLDIIIQGVPMHFHATTTDIWSNRGKLSGYSVTLSDITEIVRTNLKNTRLAMELDEERNLLKTTLLSIGDGVISTDLNAKVVLMNPIAESLTGWTQNEARGHNIEEILRLTYDKIDKDDSGINPVRRVLELGCAIEMDEDLFMISRTNKKTPIEDSATPIRNVDGTITGAVIVFHDFTEKKKRNEMVQYLSYHDQLTGIFNLRHFEEKISEYDKVEYMPVGIIMADVNGLKLANDAFGHATGDRLLKEAVRIISRNTRPSDIFSRVGGDEFVILLPRTSGNEVQDIVSRIRDGLEMQRVGELEMSVSLGWETKNQISQHIKDVYKKAEDFMYQHKLVESPEMRKKTIRRIIGSLFERIPYAKEHSQHVSAVCEAFGKALDFMPFQTNELKTAGELHDIGEIAIDYRVVNHPDALSDADWIETKRHAELGYRILSSVNEMVNIAEIVLAHHENWDGSGYPKGLAGQQIPIQSRIIRIADSYDAMVNDRIYRKSIGREAAVVELRKNSGRIFDPELVGLFIENIIGAS